jgi:hypothetical protein
MRNFLKGFLVFLFLLVSIPVSAKDLKEGQLIRRVYLDVYGFPPTSSELDWYLTYNKNGYELAVDFVLIKNLTPNIQNLLKKFLLSSSYKSEPQTAISSVVCENIIKYQSGNLHISLIEAEKRFVKLSISNSENDINPLDYMAESLMGRVTTAEEETELVKIIKRYPSEEEGYLAALQQIKTYKDFLCK